MMVDKIEKVLMERDEMTLDEAEELVEQARDELYQRLGQGEMPYDICAEWFGLEPDYVDQLV